MNFEDKDRFLMCYRVPPSVNYAEVVDWYKTEYKLIG
jgi:hypothetical protein